MLNYIVLNYMILKILKTLKQKKRGFLYDFFMRFFFSSCSSYYYNYNYYYYYYY